jgi:hypothetical protein
MEVIIKNTTSEYRKCVLFGRFDRAFNEQVRSEEKDFLDMRTGDGVEILVDGDDSDGKRLEFISKTHENPFEYSNIEYVTEGKLLDSFKILTKDANGDISIKTIQTQNYVSPFQKDFFPIIIRDLNLEIRFSTSFLFVLKPNQEINLKFVK